MNGTFDYNGFNEGLLGLTGSGMTTSNASSTTSVMTFGTVVSGGGGPGDPTVNNGGSSTIFAGSIVDGNGTMALTVSAFFGHTLILTGTGNAYSGGTTIAYGTLQIGDGATGPGSLPGNVVISSTTPGALTFNPPAGTSVTVSGNISGNGSGGLAVGGSGVVTLSGSNSYAGGTTISGGTLVLASTAAAPPNSNYTVNSYNGLVFGTGVTAGTFAGLSGTPGGWRTRRHHPDQLGRPAGALTLGANDASAVYNGALVGIGSLTKIGAGLQCIPGKQPRPVDNAAPLRPDDRLRRHARGAVLGGQPHGRDFDRPRRHLPGRRRLRRTRCCGQFDDFRQRHAVENQPRRPRPFERRRPRRHEHGRRRTDRH